MGSWTPWHLHPSSPSPQGAARSAPASRRLELGLVAALALSAHSIAVGAESSPPTANVSAPDWRGSTPPFGFAQLEIFKADANSIGLQACDIDGNGRKDLALANNAEGSIWLLIQRSEEEIRDARASEQESGELNEIGSDPRFRVEKFYTEKLVSSLVVADFDKDGKQDLAYYTDPPALTVVYQHGSWGSDRSEFPIRDGSKSPHALRAADLDGDERTDLVLLGSTKVYLFRQAEDARGGKPGLRQPETLRNAFRDPFSIDVADMNDDSRLDLVLTYPGRRESVLIRLGGEAGFGPEIAPILRTISAWLVAPLRFPSDEHPRSSILTIGSSDQRVEIHRIGEKATDGALGSPRLLALGGEQGEDRQRVIGDIDGDERPDHISTDPAGARVHVQFQDSTGTFARQDSYPTYSGVNGIACAPVDEEPGADIVVISRKEQALGVASWKEGRLHFPRSLRLPEELGKDFRPVLLGARARDAERNDANRASIFIVTESEGAKFHLSILEPEGDAAKLVTRTALETGGTAPNAMRLLDADGDGRTDVLLFVPYTDPYLYVQRSGELAKVEPDASGSADAATTAAKEDGIRFDEISRSRDFGRGQIAELRPEAFALSPSKTGPPTWIITSKQYVRLLRLGEDQRLEVLDQIGGGRAGTEYAAATAVDVDGDGEREIVVLDRATTSLEILARTENGTYRLSNTVELPAIDPTTLAGYDLDGDKRGDVLVFGKDADAVLAGKEKDTTLEEVLTWAVEDEEELGSPSDLAIGDLNGDGKQDVVVVTAPRYQLLFLEPETGDAAKTDGSAAEARVELDQRLAFPIFEEKSYMRRSSHMGPRVILAEDIDGDDLDDLVLLIHDRILLYLQQETIATPE